MVVGFFSGKCLLLFPPRTHCSPSIRFECILLVCLFFSVNCFCLFCLVGGERVPILATHPLQPLHKISRNKRVETVMTRYCSTKQAQFKISNKQDSLRYAQGTKIF